MERENALRTLGWIASLPPGTAIVFDYAVDRAKLNSFEKAALEALSERVARAGEPFRLFFDPETLATDLKQCGFRETEDLPSAEMNRRYFANREDGLRVRGNVGRLLIARV